MTRSFPALIFAVAVQAGEIDPGSDLWKDTYDPPYTKPTELPANAPLRKQLFDVLRPDVEKRAKQAVKFRGSLKAFKNWAFFTGTVLDAKDREIRFDAEKDLDYSADALWLRTKNSWVLVDFHAGSYGDFWWPVWFEKFNAPRELLPVNP